MELGKSNANFGMAFHSPSAKNMPYFKRLLANKTGTIDTKALGEFVIKQSANEKVDMCYKHTANGDVFHVFEVANPKNKVVVPCNSDVNPVKKGFWGNIKDYYNVKTAKYEYKSEGSWDNLPKEMREAGEIANKMEKELS